MTEKTSLVRGVEPDLQNYIDPAILQTPPTHARHTTGWRLQNYIDLAILQTLKDSYEGNDEPLKIIGVPLFKGDKKVKTIDRLEIAESIMVPLLYGTRLDGKLWA